MIVEYMILTYDVLDKMLFKLIFLGKSVLNEISACVNLGSGVRLLCFDMSLT